jgi:glycerol-3-phosphate dehydrogenase
MNRSNGIQRLKEEKTPWDVVIIGGGATGLGSALDAVSRGYRTVLIEQADFANGTSSRSTKLIHGGVRYLRQGNVPLVRESLREREWLLKHVPHQVRSQPFMIPTYSIWETWFYRIGLWFYDLLAKRGGVESTKRFNKAGVLERVPTLNDKKLAGGVMYWDGQFDDARLCIQTAQTVWDKGGLALNYLKVEKLIKTDGQISGVEVVDKLSGDSFVVEGRSFILATGIFSDELRHEDNPDAPKIISASRGSHIVVDAEFLPAKTAIMVPKTSDGRLLFMVPWLGKVIVGTTDIQDENICLEPQATEEEVDFIIANASPYLSRPIKRSDIRSVFSGLRPLVRPPGSSGKTSAISRDHFIDISSTGLITIAGGKWTTFRNMGEDAIDHAIKVGKLHDRPSRSLTMRFHGFRANQPESDAIFSAYGSDADILEEWIRERPELGEAIHPNLSSTWAEVLFAVREELAESVEDILARRTRSLSLDVQAAIEVAPIIAQFMAKEKGLDESWKKSSIESFLAIAQHYKLAN